MYLRQMKVWLLGTVLVALAACNQKPVPVPQAEFMGLLKVTITGIGEGASPTATAEWVKSSGVSGQAATVVPVNGTNQPGDVEFIRRLVAFEDDDVANTRHVRATFDLVNRTTTNFDNLTLYAVHVPGNLGGTAIAALTSGAGVAITDPAVARSFKPTHGMRPLLRSFEVNPNLADLQFFTPEEVDNPTDGIKRQATVRGILPSTATVLEYGFVARNYIGGRTIWAPNTSGYCSLDYCKGAITMAYQLPKVSPRTNNPFGFSLYFVVANETNPIGSQSIEEYTANTTMGLNTLDSFSQLRILAGSNLQADQILPLCRVKYAISPDVFLGPDPIPTTPGSLDVCFGATGRRTINIGLKYEQAKAVAIQSDGKIVLAGYSYTDTSGPRYSDFTMVRYNPNGALDTSFGNGGKVITDFALDYDLGNAMAIQANGKIVVAGVGGNNFAVARYNSDGSLDYTFDGDGKVTTSFVGRSEANALAIQSDGKIVVVGSGSTDPNPNPTGWDFAVIRYNTDGSLDNTFGTGGKVTTDIGWQVDIAKSVAIQPDGKIVVAGYKYHPNTLTYSPALVRYNADGSLDNTFGIGGKVIPDPLFGATNQYNSLAIQSDGKILVAGVGGGVWNEAFAVTRYNADGSLDNTFGTGGEVLTGFGSEAQALVIQGNGKIVAGGGFTLVRLNLDGSFDNTFDGDGKVTTDFGSGNSWVNSVAIQLDGKIVVAGVSSGNSEKFALARYNP